MDTEQDNTQHYQQGFNEGYVIAKHLPELSDDLAKVKNETPRMEGFRDGREQFIHEKAKEHAPSWLKRDITKNEAPSKDKQKAIDKKDMGLNKD